MNIEEMAEWLGLGINICNYCICIYQKSGCNNIRYCKDGIKQWLESEIEEVDEK